MQTMTKELIEIAPMLDWTDSFFRQFIRQITHHATLYTEMIAQNAIVYGNQERLLAYHPSEQPLVLQIGGSDENLMSQAAVIAQKKGFKAININAGCPSERVQSGAFGACLMAEPEKVASCIHAMKQVCDIPITVKTRISLDFPEDKTDGFDACCRFVEKIANAGCKKIIIHARKARLKGLTPKENRQKLPLNYEVVYRVKEKFPELFISVNGNILSVDDIYTHLKYVDGVMIGRWAYANSYALKNIDALFYNDKHPILSRKEIVQNLLPIIEASEKPLHQTRHLMGLYFATPVSKQWKQVIMENKTDAIKSFLKQVPEEL